MLLFLIVIFLISYGSLYPLDFVSIYDNSNALKAFFKTWGTYTHQGDILANLILFVPFGILGMQAFSVRYALWKSMLLVLVTGICLGVGLQIAQIYLPSRDANLSDAVLNFIGTIIGIAVSLSLNKIFFQGFKSNLHHFPVLLLYCWLAYRLIPFVPSLDWEEIKNSIKPLFILSTWELVRIYHDATAWMVVFYIVSQIKQRHLSTWYFSFVILLCFIFEIIIVNNVVSLSNAVGALLALVSWWAVFCYLKNRAVWLALTYIPHPKLAAF